MDCSFCKDKSNYTCPKCNRPYCSRKCYMDELHLQCSETFYYQEVTDVLKTIRCSDDSRKMCQEAISKIENVKELEVYDFGEYQHLWEALDDGGKLGFKEFIDQLSNGVDGLQFNEPWWTHDLKVIEEENPIPKVSKSDIKILEIKSKKFPYNTVCGCVLFYLVGCYVFLYRVRFQLDDSEQFYSDFTALSGPEILEQCDGANIQHFSNMLETKIRNGGFMENVSTQINQKELFNVFIRQVYEDILVLLSNFCMAIPFIYIAVCEFVRIIRKHVNGHKELLKIYKKCKFFKYWLIDNYQEFSLSIKPFIENKINRSFM
ncbi:Zinc finger HIT domain-containing protein 2 [Thelohanellus kitauei]|uniref:Zinc finger HIT domain-containing protein 2 n=1 Tax=Thelohanellus kitauei TaxID=669202 RepID=A0A0C2MDV1_THEKT|nr:Zinc finger HIT domain-containing protein 2 [Thelohanellus kitauei]